ncbi:MAG: hypothetical protein AAGK92_14485 [Pseudomonadota bacterium]
MAKEKKSYDLEISIGDELTKEKMMGVIERAAKATDLYISHIGSYSRVKYPNSVHWHFKRHKKEPGLIDATFWEEGAKFWLVVRNNEPQWVHETAPLLQKSLEIELAGH